MEDLAWKWPPNRLFVGTVKLKSHAVHLPPGGQNRSIRICLGNPGIQVSKIKALHLGDLEITTFEVSVLLFSLAFAANIGLNNFSLSLVAISHLGQSNICQAASSCNKTWDVCMILF